MVERSLHETVHMVPVLPGILLLFFFKSIIVQ